MKQLWKRLTAWLLACVMLVALLPAQAFAAERRTAAAFEDVTAGSISRCWTQLKQGFSAA